MSQVKVLSGGAAAAVVRGVQAQFEQQAGAGVDATFSAVGQMRDRLLAGAPCDLVILTRPLVAQLVASGHVRAGSERSLGLVRTGIAVQAGSPHPDIGGREALAAAFRAASEIYHPDPQLATAGIHFMSVLTALGLAEPLAARLRPFPNGATAMGEMARSPRKDVIGCTQETEINYTPGVELVGSLPAEFELATDYVLAVCTHAAQPALAQRLAELVAGPPSEAIRRQGGFIF
ncbi:molybdate ABC transporter substrate-binding protein [Ramlibacter rhizophilus]|uniref:ABC transporter substrate-binding protein n=1 Tax=Ramlibacter rhizophilus TaxID=1781167 RepID=A0A4Z0BJP2_9BURK|nr:substrate-binding domain-containing protein [Ramlibacter rhizophilus]TFY99542.1 ABC transporter substrate-binding protein [Ramlibacter rhizophilus]